MTRLYDLAEVLRSKNAGPFQITIDLMFADLPRYRRVLDSRVLSPTAIAELYGVPASEVSVIPFERVRAIKVTLPRTMGTCGSGSAFDLDVYGAQQHGPLADLDVP
jgi:Domain of unknown function (DUF4387)